MLIRLKDDLVIFFKFAKQETRIVVIYYDLTAVGTYLCMNIQGYYYTLLPAYMYSGSAAINL